MKTFTYEFITILLGENAQENWSIITDAQPDFWWFHLSSFPSGHVILCSPILTKSSIQECAKICREHTKYKNIPNLKVDYTQISNLRKGTNVGEVCFKRPKLVYRV